MSFLGGASGLAKVTFVILVGALVIHCVGFGTTSWMKYQTTSSSLRYVIGLWRMDNCSGTYNAPCSDAPIPDNFYNTQFVLTRAFETCGLISLVITCVLSGFYFASPAVRVKAMAVAILIMCFMSGLYVVCGMVTWMVNLPEDHFLYWSMGLTVLAASLAFLCAILMIPDIRNYDYQRKKLDMEMHMRKERRTMRAARANHSNIEVVDTKM